MRTKIKRLSNRLRVLYVKQRSQLFAKKLLDFPKNRPYISFTFDDFPRSAYFAGGKILEDYGVKGSYYVSFGLMDQESVLGSLFSLEDLDNLRRRGHELGSHTYHHMDAWCSQPGVFEDSIRRNEEALRSFFPEERFLTMSYPKSEPHPWVKTIGGKHFLCCRGGGQTFNNSPLDGNFIRSCFLDWRTRDNLGLLKSLIDNNTAARGWLVFSTHDLSENPSRFGCRPDFFARVVAYAMESGSVILPVRDVYHALFDVSS